MASRLPDIPIRVSSFPLYDTFRTTAGASIPAQTVRLFQNGLGAVADGFAAPGKNKAQTNIERSGGLPMGQAYKVFGVSVGLFAVRSAVAATMQDAQAAALNMANIAHGCVLEYEAGALLRTLGPIEAFPFGGGLQVQSVSQQETSAAGVIGDIAIAQNGQATCSARWKLDEPVILRDGSSFSWNLNIPSALTMVNVPAGANEIDISIWLHGVSFQEVQG
jgi:hypothetical protein